MYPLYNKNEELKYFLVEFEPYGFVFVLLLDEQPKFLSIFGATTSMYKLSEIYGNHHTWSPYIIDKTNTSDKLWILDENGEKIFYNKSPYFISGNIDKKKYLLETDKSARFVCAVKQNDKFKNLISGIDFDIANNDSINIQATLYLPFINKGSFDL